MQPCLAPGSIGCQTRSPEVWWKPGSPRSMCAVLTDPKSSLSCWLVVGGSFPSVCTEITEGEGKIWVAGAMRERNVGPHIYPESGQSTVKIAQICSVLCLVSETPQRALSGVAQQFLTRRTLDGSCHLSPPSSLLVSWRRKLGRRHGNAINWVLQSQSEGHPVPDIYRTDRRGYFGDLSFTKVLS